MRCLLIDIAVEYMNPTRNLLPRLLAGACELTCFGPGYSSAEELERGLSEFLDKNDKFDFVLATEHILWADEIPSDAHETVYAKFLFWGDRAHLKYASRICREFLQLDARKIGLLLESDYYNFQQKQIERLDQLDAVVGWGLEFVTSIASLPELRYEKFGAKANDNWHTFVSRTQERVISIPHYVGDNEFCFRSMAERRWTWAIPGTAYWARQEVRQRLPITETRSRRLPIAAALARFGLHPFSWPWFLDYYQRAFREEIREARFSFTCGSALKYPVRKFFEIPALGSMLVCWPCQGFNALGFQHMQNAVTCEPREILDVHSDMCRNPDRAQIIVDAGRRVVLETHTVAARSQQLRLAFDALLHKQYFGSRWQQGRFELLAPPVAVQR